MESLPPWSAFTPTAQIVAGFATGLIFSSFNSALSLIILFLLIYEVLLYGYHVYNKNNRCIQTRINVIIGYILGWVLGRSVYGNKCEV